MTEPSRPRGQALHLNRSADLVHAGVIGYDAVLSQLEYSTYLPCEALDSGAFPPALARFLHAAIGLRRLLS